MPCARVHVHVPLPRAGDTGPVHVPVTGKRVALKYDITGLPLKVPLVIGFPAQSFPLKVPDMLFVVFEPLLVIVFVLLTVAVPLRLPHCWL